MKSFIYTFCLIVFATSVAQAEWTNPIRKVTYLGSPLAEVTPFVFNDRLFLLENEQTYTRLQPKITPGILVNDDVVRIRDLTTGQIIAAPLKGCGFGTALVHDGRVYIFAGYFMTPKAGRKVHEVKMTCSTDLKEWTEPVSVLHAEEGQRIYNTAVCYDPDLKRFVMLYETNDPQYPTFTFKYAVSNDLVNWKKLPKAIYGKNRYVGGPALYYEGGWYYTLALWNVSHGWETHIARSKDLIQWEDAPENRPFITFDTRKIGCPHLPIERHECNASDVELCHYKGKTIIYFTGGDQSTCGDLQYAEFDGSPRELFEIFFKE